MEGRRILSRSYATSSLRFFRQLNHPGGDEHLTTFNAFLRARKDKLLGQAHTSPSIALVSPPGQGFSIANQGGQNDFENNNLMSSVSKIAKAMRPHWLVVENVAGFVHVSKVVFLI